MEMFSKVQVLFLMVCCSYKVNLSAVKSLTQNNFPYFHSSTLLSRTCSIAHYIHVFISVIPGNKDDKKKLQMEVFFNFLKQGEQREMTDFCIGRQTGARRLITTTLPI